MNDLERAIIDLVRMGLRGDVDSVRQYGRRLLRRAAPGAGPEGDYREALGEVLMSTEATAPALRRGAAVERISEPSPVFQGGPMPTRSRSRAEPPASSLGSNAPVDPGSALRLVRVGESTAIRKPILSEGSERIVAGLIEERERSAELHALGVAPSRTVLLTGAPGVGKTMTAAYLASALRLPLIQVDLAAVMSSFLGRTGQNLRQVLDYARAQPCVLLLDEFDALAKRRDDLTDVGELKRIVNVLLMELEAWPTEGLLVAATNHPELLDRAIWRRFDVVVALDVPDLGARQRILEEAFATAYGVAAPVKGAARHVMSPESVQFAALVMDGASGSELAQVVRAALRDAALTASTPEDALARVAAARAAAIPVEDHATRLRLARLAVEKLGWTHRRTGEALGVSHVTIGNWLRGTADGMEKESPTARPRSGTPTRKRPHT